MQTNNPGKGLGQVPEEIEIKGERIGGGGGKRERGRKGRTDPNAAPIVNHRLGQDMQSRQCWKALPKRSCKYTGKDIPGRIPAAVTPDEDDATRVGGTTETSAQPKRKGAKLPVVWRLML